MENICSSVALSSLFLLSHCLSGYSQANNTITYGQSIRDGETVISAGKKFELGFFSPGNSTYRYVGIWCHRVPIQTVVWVANRENPISDTTGAVTIGNNGNLVILDGNRNVIWSTNASLVSPVNSTAILMDSGNLILTWREDIGNLDGALWQSFNNPTDTFLPGMRVGLNLRTGENTLFKAWKSPSDPSAGSYSMGVDPRKSPQVLIWERSRLHWRSGEWNGQIFTGIPEMRIRNLYGFKLSNEEREGKMYVTYKPVKSSDILIFRLRWDGIEEELGWDEGKKEWSNLWSQPINKCELYNHCGNFGSCSLLNSPICSCLKGFEPKSIDEWSRGNWSGGCIRRTQLQCDRNSTFREEKGDGFRMLEGMKLPDSAVWVPVENSTKCADACLKNCSFSAYAYINGNGCMTWGRELVDIQQFSQGGNNLYIRLANSELVEKSKILKLRFVIIIVLGTMLIGLSICFWRFDAKIKDFWRRNRKLSLPDLSNNKEFSNDFSAPDDLIREGNHGSGPELPVYGFNCVAVATSNFSDENRLGQGGFGPVYKATWRKPNSCQKTFKKLWTRPRGIQN